MLQRITAYCTTLVLLCVCSGLTFAQNATIDSVQAVAQRNNYMLFNTQPVSMANGVNIVHIGDSHIQAGYWGNALMHALDSATTNVAYEPYILPHRFIKGQLITPQVSVYTLNEYSVKSCAKKNYDTAFTHLSYFKSTDSLIGFIVKHNINVDVKFETSNNYTLQTRTIVNTGNVTDTLYYTRVDTGAFMLWTISVKYTAKNSYYNLGLNGASYTTVANYFNDYVAYITRANVIILSLGANDAYNTAFDSLQFYRQALSVIHNCYTTSNARIIITNAGHAQYNASELCNNVPVVNAILKRIAVEYDLSYWDWYNVMGSKHCYNAWLDCSLARNDYIHLTPAGYKLQASLFNNVFLKLLVK
jgi:lysophospholipase L1-like esterase